MSYSIKFLCDNHITEIQPGHTAEITSLSAKGGAR